MKWQWQKAVQISGFDPSLNGHVMWVKGPPIERTENDIGISLYKDGRQRLNTGNGEMWFDTNILGHDGGEVSVRARRVELLLEFAETVEMMSWNEFVNQKI